MRRLRRTLALAGLVDLAFMGMVGLTAASAHAAFGDQLESFDISTYEARGIAITGSTALLSNEDSAAIDEVNLASHESAGEIATTGGPASGFGALAVDPTGRLWAAEYSSTEGNIDLIGAGGAVQKVFNAAELDPEDTYVDGLAIGADGSFWISGEGLQPGPTRVDHFRINSAAETVEEVGHFTVPFGNSGVAIDGEGHLWLAEIESSSGGWGTEIHEYTEAGAEVRSFLFGTAGGEAIHPEGIALDHCTFPGKLALWAYGANGVTSPLAAYEVGTTSDTSGCPARNGPSISAGGAGGGGATAGGRTLLVAGDPADPTGTLFVYLWRFGDGHRLRGHGRVWHRYRCAGLYRVTVTEIDSQGARHVSRGRLSVGFPRRATKRYRGLRFSPHVRVAGHRAKLWLSWRGRGRGVRARSVDWTLDRRHGWRFPIHSRAVARIRLGRNHRFQARVHFSNRHATTIRACFHA